MLPLLSLTISVYHTTARWPVGTLESTRKRTANHELHDSLQFVDDGKEATVDKKAVLSSDVAFWFTNGGFHVFVYRYKTHFEWNLD